MPRDLEAIGVVEHNQQQLQQQEQQQQQQQLQPQPQQQRQQQQKQQQQQQQAIATTAEASNRSNSSSRATLMLSCLIKRAACLQRRAAHGTLLMPRHDVFSHLPPAYLTRCHPTLLVTRPAMFLPGPGLLGDRPFCLTGLPGQRPLGDCPFCLTGLPADNCTHCAESSTCHELGVAGSGAVLLLLLQFGDRVTDCCGVDAWRGGQHFSKAGKSHLRATQHLPHTETRG